MKKIKKALKIIFLFIAVLGTFATLSGVGYYYAVTFSVSLEKDKLENLQTTSVEIYDANNIKILPASQAYAKIEDLSHNTINAFICAEDKRFFSHHGIDYVRVVSALKNNLKTKSFSQGASTISQQLIKNTHLSSEKTIRRKLKEIKLTKQLEKNYSKNEILEMYLNNIYFGNSCYGIENASMHYFSKPASQLSLSESALLAGTINAPGIYDIQAENDKAINRRNLILSLMKKNGKISTSEYESASAEKINLNLKKLDSNSFVYNEILTEACKHLGKTENELKNSGIKIYTYYDTKLADQIQSTISKSYSLGADIDTACMILDNKTGGIVCCIGSKTLNEKHQPGSVIKPILVYAPAIENNIVSPATKILDEKIEIGGYSPENADGSFHGFVSVRDALANSYNIPAVKLLNEIGIENAQGFAEKLGIEFSEKDNNLAIALGGFTDGVSIKSLATAYTAFANGGNIKKTQYISKIMQKGNKIYENNEKYKKVMSDSTAYLITEMLKNCSKYGTAKRLKDLPFQVASKTGTVGKSNSTKNTDAYNVSYTTSCTIVTYFGGKDMSEKINGATYPTMLSRDILNLIHKSDKPENFTVPDSVVSKSISKSNYAENKIVLTDNPSDQIKEIFAKSNLPKEKVTPSLKLQVFNFENRKPIICFMAPENHSYKIIRRHEEAEEIISSTNSYDNKIIKFEDKLAKSNEIYEYLIEFCDFLTNKSFSTNTVKLKAF